MNPPKTKRAEIARRLQRGESTRVICAALRASRALVGDVRRTLGLSRGASVRWVVCLPVALSDACDRARGPLSRTAWATAALARVVDAEARREGP
jgi:hypothetical protein